ncbi:MAG: tRNA (adenosine(37)-N6)-threonylcarbamoyltransferase complex ATPase subunit type 1 TsaE [Phycisphaerales bacterium JB050]
MAAERLEIISESEDQTVQVGRVIGEVIPPGTVVVLEGELGSGKTRLTWGIAEALGVDRAAVSSPTYALVHEYDATDARRLIHADAYRMDAGDADDFETLLGIGEGEPDWFAIIEWGSRIAELLPEDHLEVSMSHSAGTVRRIALEGNRKLMAQLRRVLEESRNDG